MATTYCWVILALSLSLNGLDDAEAWVTPHFQYHHHIFPNSEGSKNNNKNKMMTTTTVTTTTTLSHKKKNFDSERSGQDIDDADQASVSVSSYLHPAASKLAPHVQVSWEPDAAKTIKQLAKISDPSRPFMIGVVGIPGSGKSTSCEILAAYLQDEVGTMIIPM
jgi:ABC-type glutathione transport system ATPase component